MLHLYEVYFVSNRPHLGSWLAYVLAESEERAEELALREFHKRGKDGLVYSVIVTSNVVIIEPTMTS